MVLECAVVYCVLTRQLGEHRLGVSAHIKKEAGGSSPMGFYNRVHEIIS